MSLVSLLSKEREQRVRSGVGREKRRKGARKERRERERVKRQTEIGKWQGQRKRRR